MQAGTLARPGDALRVGDTVIEAERVAITHLDEQRLCRVRVRELRDPLRRADDPMMPALGANVEVRGVPLGDESTLAAWARNRAGGGGCGPELGSGRLESVSRRLSPRRHPVGVIHRRAMPPQTTPDPNAMQTTRSPWRSLPVDRLRQRDRDRRAAGVAVPIDVYHHPVEREVQALRHRLDDAEVGLVGDEQGHIVERPAGLRAHRVRAASAMRSTPSLKVPLPYMRRPSSPSSSPALGP